MPSRTNRTQWIVQGTVIALLTWGVLTLAKDYLGRTASLIVAGLIFLAFIFTIWARAQVRQGGSPPPPE